ncbi:hypothetical protein H5410_023696 [Solanum commersonii]|uniref:Uncharacterized protein n=1 Tax=Solanum commersonii TaxID=4109 RepID=A0A9J5ZJD5_SOLCO|nr:hypothetical protein H5410_023696 [Solanum commersonii]
MSSSESSGITVDDNVDLTIGEVESSTAIVFANRRTQRQQALPVGSEFSNFQPEVINPQENLLLQNHSRNMSHGMLYAPR